MKKLNSKKASIIGVGVSVLLAGGILAGCMGTTDTTPDTPNTVEPQVTASAVPSTASPEPSASASKNTSQEQFDALTPELQSRYGQAAGPELSEQILENADKAPMFIDIEKTFASSTAPDVLGTFSEEEYKTKAGVTSALKAYEELLSISAWSKARNGADDAKLIESLASSDSGEAVFSAEQMAQLKESIAANGRLTFIPTVESDGNARISKDVAYPTDGTSTIITASGQPKIEMNESAIHIEGKRSFSLKLAGGKTLVGERLWFFDVTPNQSGPWIMSNIGEKHLSVAVRDTAEYEAELALAIAKSLSAAEGN